MHEPRTTVAGLVRIACAAVWMAALGCAAGSKPPSGEIESRLQATATAGETQPGTAAVAALGTAPAGQKPAAAYGAHVAVTATITAIDPGAGTVTIEGPGGSSRTFKARDPKNLERVAVGDLVDIDYTEALAVEVRDTTPH